MTRERLLLGWMVIAVLLAAPAQADVIHDRARDGDIERVRELIMGGTNVDETDESQRTALQYASEEGHQEVVALLLSHRAEVDHEDAEGRTALIMAAARGHREIVKLLLAAGANVDHRARDGARPISVAAAEKHDGVVQLLRAAALEQSPVTGGATASSELETWDVLSASGYRVTLEQGMTHYEVSGALGKWISPAEPGMGLDCPITIRYGSSVMLHFDAYCRLQAVRQ